MRSLPTLHIFVVQSGASRILSSLRIASFTSFNYGLLWLYHVKMLLTKVSYSYSEMGLHCIDHVNQGVVIRGSTIFHLRTHPYTIDPV